jgi:hypothetical protein
MSHAFFELRSTMLVAGAIRCAMSALVPSIYNPIREAGVVMKCFVPPPSMYNPIKGTGGVVITATGAVV